MSRLLTQTMIQAPFAAQIEAEQGGQFVSALALTPTSNQYEETYRWLNPAPAPQLWQGERRVTQVTARGVTIRNAEWENSVSFYIPDLRRSIVTDMVNMKMRELAQRLVINQWAMLNGIIKDGDTTAFLGYDGKKLYDTTHSDGLSGTQINDVAAAQVAALNIGTPTAPTADEFSLAIMGMWAHMLTFKDAEGEPMNEMARRFVVATTPPLAPALIQAITRENLASGATNPLRGLIDGGYTFEPLVLPRVDWTAEFAMFRTDGLFKPIILQEENPAQVDLLDETSEHAFKTNHCLAGGKWSGGVGIARWEYTAKGTFS